MVLAEGTTNTLADGSSYADTGEDAATAALYSSDTLAITGTGSLDVTGSYKDGISSKNGLVIAGGPTITVNAADDGVRGKDYSSYDFFFGVKSSVIKLVSSRKFFGFRVEQINIDNSGTKSKIGRAHV